MVGLGVRGSTIQRRRVLYCTYLTMYLVVVLVGMYSKEW